VQADWLAANIPFGERTVYRPENFKICYDFSDSQDLRKSESVEVTTFRKAHKVKSPSLLNFAQSVSNRIKSPRYSEGWDTT